MAPGKVSEQLAERLRGEIANGKHKPGEMLPPESIMMESYGVGRPSMREAQRILESEGLLRIVRGPRGGAEVLDLDVVSLAKRAGLYLQLRGADLADLRVARALIDPGAVALAAKRRAPEDIEALRECIERVRACRDPDDFGEIAADFVERLLVASGNHTLALLSLVIDRLLRQELRRYMWSEGWETGERAGFYVQEWTDVVDRIEAGDAEGAVAAWESHRARTTPPALAETTAPVPLVVYPKRSPHRAPKR